MFVYLATLASTLASKISRLNSHVQYHCKPNKRMYESWSRLSALRHNIMKTLHAKSSHKNRIKNMTLNNWNKYTCRKKNSKAWKYSAHAGTLGPLSANVKIQLVARNTRLYESRNSKDRLGLWGVSAALAVLKCRRRTTVSDQWQ